MGGADKSRVTVDFFWVGPQVFYSDRAMISIHTQRKSR